MCSVSACQSVRLSASPFLRLSGAGPAEAALVGTCRVRVDGRDLDVDQRLLVR